MARKRALGVIRLSVETDDTTSPQRQKEIITAKAGQRDSAIVGWAVDLDISATKYPPTKRPDLARWLKMPGSYDEIIFWRLDRFVRKPSDLTDMIRWSESNGKGLVSATESFDLHEPLGEAMAYLAAIFARMETRATSERVAGAQEYLRRNMRWGGGRPPYGYMIVANPDGAGKILVINPETAPYVVEAVKRVIAGESVNSVAADFNRRHIPPPHGHKIKPAYPGAQKARCVIPRVWGDSSLRKILRDKAMLGHVVYKDESVLGDDGMPLIRAEALISVTDWDRLQRALDALSQTHKRTNTPSMLLNVAFCGLHESEDIPLYKWQHRNRTGGTIHPYYRCRRSYNLARQQKDCYGKLIRVGTLDQIVDEAVMAYADCPHAERKLIPGDDHSRELAEVRQAMADLFTERVVRRVERPNYAQAMADLEAKEVALQTMPIEPDRYAWVPDGRLVGDVWPALDNAGKRQWLLDNGWKVYAHRDESGELVTVIECREFLDEIMALQALAA